MNENNNNISSAEMAMRALTIVQMFFQNGEITQTKKTMLVGLIKHAKQTSDFSEVKSEFRKLKLGSVISEHVSEFLNAS